MNILKDYTVYKIVLEDGYEYVGSSCNLKRRMNNHISMCYNENDQHYKTPLYKHIRENKLKFSKDNFIVLEEVKNISETQARIIEEKYRKESVIQGGNILNDYRAYLSEQERKELYKKYHIQNREKFLEIMKQYHFQNRNKISERKKQKYTCICGSTLTIQHKARHERSLKHLNYVSTLNK
jgi:hypothetical protein